MNKYSRLLAVMAVTLALLSASIIWLNRDRIVENDDFFTLSIGPVPQVDAEAWSLRVTGLVDRPITLNISDIMALPKAVQVSTLKCVDGPFGTAEWGGVPLSVILQMAGANLSAGDVVFRSVDGFTTSLTPGDCMAEGVLLAYEMNGEPLPADQGHPLRLVAPEKYGYKWAKWISEIEVVSYDHLGFWESRGWDDDATISSYKDWGWHAALLTLSAGLCGLACVSGFKYAPEENFWTDLPAFISVGFHIAVSKAYFLVALPVFSLWAWNTLQARGGVFYSGHGMLGLAVLVLTIAGMATGALATWSRNRFSRLHLMVSTLCFFLLVGTIISGIWLIMG